MSTINKASLPLSSPPVSPLVLPNNTARPNASVSPEALNALLHSGPSNTNKPKQPSSLDNKAASPTDEQDLTGLGGLLNENMVKRALRDPASSTSEKVFQELEKLKTTEQVSAFRNDPKNGEANAHILTEVKKLVNNDAINAAITPIEAEQIEAYRKAVDASLLDLKYSLLKAPLSSRFDMIRSYANAKPASMQKIEEYLELAGSKAKFLCNIAKTVQAEHGSLKFGENAYINHPRSDTDDIDRKQVGKPHQPSIYSYANTNEGSLSAPSEIRNFVHERDKIDVSGIGTQLNKTLQSVNQLSGASGEMLIKYSPHTNTSVLVISGKQGEPAFIAKVFGKLTENDLLT
ncbi:M10 family metallopeptidase C-terminal domain-containing protein [Pseudomonas poae]|uniref:Peptidase M10 serralysin C-terminal domain-containing protein n=1 Tax=Pseudomonas poae TaxID=200451 RepID=A0A2S9EBQ4_9PSED|nr:M10 family metallopeptidase C-terminal domain-containing protein [Pseudomonas poae]PRA25802.1 hypothetical protein CQZ97_22625 [Pseudomonas poae]PRC12366.1 hypothetical protein CQZ99_23360 [Pseudomonas poae]